MESPCIKAVSSGNLAIYQMTFKNVGDQDEGHPHSFHHFTLVAEGRVAVHSNDRVSEYPAHSMIWIPKGVAHIIKALEPFSVVYCIQALHKKDDPGDVLDDAEIPGGTPDWFKVYPLLQAAALKQRFE